ncbi:hypothetical protein D7B12_17805 [Salmonella enterica]|nr:hypothetical protein [Salmonella enterica]
MRTMLKRLLGHLHRAVFDTSTDDVVAFYLDGPEGSSWVAVDELFTITFKDGTHQIFNLNDYKIFQFINALKKAGMTVSRPNPDCSLYSGITMLELEGKAGKPNPIILYQDVLHSLFGAYAREMRLARDNVDAAIEQMEIQTANDGFLDLWGRLFSALKTPGLEEDKYRDKIRRLAFRKRVNGYAIEKIVFEETQQVISIEEPWRNIFRMDISQLSGTNEFYNGTETGYFLVQPVSYRAVNWDEILPIIQRNIAAGVKILNPAIRGMFLVETPLNGNVGIMNWSMMSQWVIAHSMPRLDNEIVLSGKYEMQLNYSVSIDSNYAVQWVTPVESNIRRDNSNILAADVRWGDVPIKTWFTGNKLGDWLKMYPVEPRNWMQGKWDKDATWHTPYTWKVFSRASGSEDAFYVANVREDGNGNVIEAKSWLQPTIITASQEGWSWEDPQEWSSDRWDKGSSISYYIKAAPAVPALKDEFKTNVTSKVTEMTLTHDIKKGPMRIVFTRYDESDNSAVSGGMADCVGSLSVAGIVDMTQESTGYAFNMVPKKTGVTVFTIQTPSAKGVSLILTIKIEDRIPWTDATTPSVMPWTEINKPIKTPWTELTPAITKDIPATSVTLRPIADVDMIGGLEHPALEFTTIPPDASGYTMKWELVDSLYMPYVTPPDWVSIDKDTGVWTLAKSFGNKPRAGIKLTLINKNGKQVYTSSMFYPTVYPLTVTTATNRISFGSIYGGKVQLQLNWGPKLIYKNEEVEVHCRLTDSRGYEVTVPAPGIVAEDNRTYPFAPGTFATMYNITLPPGIPVTNYRLELWATYRNLKGGVFSIYVEVK